MKNLFLFITTFCLGICLNAQEQQIKINTTKSSIAWTGSQLFQFNKHSGIVNIKSGTIITKDFKLTGGDFVIDMNTITNTDGKHNEMLVTHLKNDDFFNVKEYPESKLKISRVIYKDGGKVEVYADLTIKNITNPIKFYGTIGGSNGNVKLESQFIIDRTRWGINYESKGVFGSVKDSIISDAIEFNVVIEWFQDMC